MLKKAGLTTNRELADADAGMIGVSLMTHAFKPDGGVLVDDSMEQGEKVARMNLFCGAIGSFKNPASDRTVDYADAMEAAEVVLHADLLLRILDRLETSSQQISPEETPDHFS